MHTCIKSKLHAHLIFAVKRLLKYVTLSRSQFYQIEKNIYLSIWYPTKVEKDHSRFENQNTRLDIHVRDSRFEIRDLISKLTNQIMSIKSSFLETPKSNELKISHKLNVPITAFIKN